MFEDFASQVRGPSILRLTQQQTLRYSGTNLKEGIRT